MLKLIKDHWVIFLLAFLIGIVSILPTIVSIQKVGPEFNGIFPMWSDDEVHYLALTREVYDGHFNLGNVFLKEHKDEPFLQQPLAQIFFVFIAKLFNISIPTLFAINDFVFPFICVLLCYVLIFRLTSSKSISAAISGLFFILFLLSFGRPINPQFSFIFLLLGLIVIWKIISEETDHKKLASMNFFLAVIFGILFYIYPFFWTALISIYFLFLAFFIFLNRSLLFHYGKGLLYFLMPAILFTIPYVINIAKAGRSLFWDETNIRFGFLFNHWPSAFLNVFLVLLCLPLVYILGKWMTKKQRLFSYVLIVSNILLNWQNVITGKNYQITPHYYLPSVFFLFIIIALCINAFFLMKLSIIDKKKWILYVFCCSLYITLLFGIVVYKQKNEIKTIYNNISAPQEIGPVQKLGYVAEWFNSQSPKDSVVYALGENYDWLFPLYTHNNIYWQTYAGMYLMSDDELENRWAIAHFFDDIDESDIEGNREIWTNKFIDNYQNKEVRRKIFEFFTGKKYPETVLMDQVYIDRVLEKHEKFQKNGFEKALKTYAADYVIVDSHNEKYKNIVTTLNKYHFLSPIAHIEGAFIYKVR